MNRAFVSLAGWEEPAWWQRITHWLHAMIVQALSSAVAAGFARAARYLVYQLFGFLVINAVALATDVMLQWHLSPAAITVGTFMVTSAASGARRSALFGKVDPSVLPTVPVPGPLPPAAPQ